MPRIVKKPDQLFKQIKPDGIELRGSIVETPYRDPYSVLKRDYLSNQGTKIVNGQLRSKYGVAYNGTAADAQKSANTEGITVGTHDPKMKRFLPRTKGEYGHVALPEQWKYKPAKNPIEAANLLSPTKEYQRKSDGHKFVLYPDSPNFLFSTQDDSGKSDVALKDGQLDTDFDFLKEYMED